MVLFPILSFIHTRLQCTALYISVIARNIVKISESKGLGCLHEMQEIRIRLPTETIFFAISLLQFFKIKFGKFGGIINISD